MNFPFGSKLPEGKREDFMRYLQETSVLDDFAKVITSLYEEPEKPKDPLKYVCDKLSNQVGNETMESLTKKRDEAEAKVLELLKARNKTLRKSQTRWVQGFEPLAHTYRRVFLDFNTENSDEKSNSEIPVESTQVDEPTAESGEQMSQN